MKNATSNEVVRVAVEGRVYEVDDDRGFPTVRRVRKDGKAGRVLSYCNRAHFRATQAASRVRFMAGDLRAAVSRFKITQDLPVYASKIGRVDFP